MEYFEMGDKRILFYESVICKNEILNVSLDIQLTYHSFEFLHIKLSILL